MWPRSCQVVYCMFLKIILVKAREGASKSKTFFFSAIRRLQNAILRVIIMGKTDAILTSYN